MSAPSKPAVNAGPQSPVILQRFGIDLNDWCHEDIVIRAAKRCIFMGEVRFRMLNENADAWELISTDLEVLARGTLSAHEILKQ